MAEYTLASPRLWIALEGWPFRQHIAAYIERLQTEGFSDRHTFHAVRAVGEYARWLIDHHGDQIDVHESTIAAFMLWRAEQPGYRHGTRIAIVRLLRLLREAGAVAPATLPEAPQAKLLRDYALHLGQRGLSAKSIAGYTWFAKDSLPDLWQSDVGLGQLSRSDVIRFVENKAPQRSPSTAGTMCGALRSFLRYLRSAGIVDDDLAASVPSVKTWKLSSLPSYLSNEQLAVVLDRTDRATVAGRRDFAILLLLARLGLRANEVAMMKLDDIDWNAGVFRITGKGGARATMPMPSEVGAAIADYLQHGRPSCKHREVFLRVETPIAPFASYISVSLLARRALVRAGIAGLAHKHAHVFRHTLATGMINAGATLGEIGQLLRHKDHDTTRIYAKVDLAGLRQLAQPWPGAVH
jgi:site-specific recombinase XerD